LNILSHTRKNAVNKNFMHCSYGVLPRNIEGYWLPDWCIFHFFLIVT